jgi:hypothetical protein
VVVLSTSPLELVTVPTRGTVVIADWEALPVAEASPEAVPVTPALERAGSRMVSAAEGETLAPDEMAEATPGIDQQGLADVLRRRLTLAKAGSVANSLASLLSIAGLAGAVANAVGPVGLRAEATVVASRASELGVGDQVHVVDTQLLEGVSIVYNTSSNAAMRECSRYVQRSHRGSGRWQRQQRRRGGSWTASS